MRVDRWAPKRGLLIMVGVAALVSCSSRSGPPDDGLEPGGLVITREEIDASGARDAFEVVERTITHLQIQRTRGGVPPRVTHRGIDTFNLSPQILVVVDGSRVRSVVGDLRAIPAESIEFIQILSDREATLRFGSDGGNGVIVVRTTAH
ncbi:MAG: TonB-dependent receptor [Longimicrobiales bacterium]